MKILNIFLLSLISICIFTSCRDSGNQPNEKQPELSGFWKIYTKTWNIDEPFPKEGAVKIVQKENDISIFQSDTLLVEGQIDDKVIKLNSFFLDCGITEIKIESDNCLLTGTPLVEPVDYFKLKKIELTDEWDVTDYWFDDTEHSLGTWQIYESFYQIVILNGHDTVSNGVLNYDTLKIDDISGYGVKNIFVKDIDTLFSEIPLMESSDGLSFVRKQ
jgi:hypothetical protein